MLENCAQKINIVSKTLFVLENKLIFLSISEEIMKT